MHSGFVWAKSLLKLSLKEGLQHEKISIKLNIVVQVRVRAQMTYYLKGLSLSLLTCTQIFKVVSYAQRMLYI